MAAKCNMTQKLPLHLQPLTALKMAKQTFSKKISFNPVFTKTVILPNCYQITRFDQNVTKIAIFEHNLNLATICGQISFKLPFIKFALSHQFKLHHPPLCLICLVLCHFANCNYIISSLNTVLNMC